jgi:hypothetical protein
MIRDEWGNVKADAVLAAHGSSSGTRAVKETGAYPWFEPTLSPAERRLKANGHVDLCGIALAAPGYAGPSRAGKNSTLCAARAATPKC